MASLTFVVVGGVVGLLDGEELGDFGGPLGTEALGLHLVGQLGDVGLALDDDDEMQDLDVGADDAAADGFLLLVALSSDVEAFVALSHEESDSFVSEDALDHGEALMVLPARDLEDVALELVSDEIAFDLIAHLLVVEERPNGESHCFLTISSRP